MPSLPTPTNDPNATAVALSGAIVTLIAWAASTFAGVDLTSTVSAAAVTLVLSVILWLNGPKKPQA